LPQDTDFIGRLDTQLDLLSFDSKDSDDNIIPNEDTLFFTTCQY
jgi:hypothetical protein